MGFSWHNVARLHRWTLLLLFVSLFLPAQVARAEEETELVLWDWVSASPANPNEAATAARQKAFLQEFPWIRVRMGGGPQMQKFGRGTREFLMAQAGGVAPDVIDMSDVDLQDFISRNFLLPLNPFLEQIGALDEVLNHPLAAHYARNGQVYALPFSPASVNNEMRVLVYRKDLFRRAGLDPEKPPATWPELLDCAIKLTNPAEGRIGLVIPTLETKGMGAGAFLELLFALNGAQALSPSGETEIRSNIANDPRAREAMDLLASLLSHRFTQNGRQYQGVAASSAGAIDDLWKLAVGEVGMVIQPMNQVAAHISRGVPQSDIGIALLPLGPSGAGFVPMTSRFLGVNSLSPPQRQKSAWEWVWFNQRPELAQLQIKAYVDAGWTMFLDPRNVEKDPEYAGFVSDIPDQWQGVWRTMMGPARPLPMCADHRRLRQDYLARPVWELLANPEADVKALLQQTEQSINEEVLGHVPPEVKQRRRNIGMVAVVLVGAGLLVGGWLVVQNVAMTGAGMRTAGTAGVQAGRGRVYFIAGAMMLPAVLSTILWAYLPLGRGAMMAFQDYQIAGESRWAGLDNFIAVLTDKLFWISIWRTIQYAIITLTLGFAAPIALAILLSEVPRFRVSLRVIYCLPAMTSGLVILFFFKWMYEPTDEGLFNSVIHWVGTWFGQEWGPLKWLDSESLAMISVILPGVWAGLGPGSIIYLAALHSVPEEMYEAADLDGAGAWTKIWNVAMPHIKPLIIINFVGAFIATFQAMQNVFVTTGGGPGDSTYLVGLYIFLNSFVWLQFGKATAAAWIIGSLLIGFTVFQLRLLRNMKFQTAGNGKER